MGDKGGAVTFGRDDGTDSSIAPDQRRAAMRDPRRTRNVITGLLLAAVAASFFVLIIVKYMVYGQ